MTCLSYTRPWAESRTALHPKFNLRKVLLTPGHKTKTLPHNLTWQPSLFLQRQQALVSV